MQDLNAWLTIGIWGMVVADYIFCFILAREIALQKGHPAQKAWFFAAMGPLSLFRFLMEGFSLIDMETLRSRISALPDKTGKNSQPFEPENAFEQYRQHHRFEELLQLVAHDEGVAFRLITLEQNKTPNSNLDRWIDLAIFHLEHDRGAHKFQYAAQEY